MEENENVEEIKEEAPQEEKKEYIKHIFDNKKLYEVLSNEWAGKTFYNLKLFTTRYDGQTEDGRIRAEFVKCDPPINGTKIRIKNAKEDWYKKGKFDTIFKIVIFDYEIAQPNSEIANEAINEFYSKDNDDFELPF